MFDLVPLRRMPMGRHEPLGHWLNRVFEEEFPPLGFLGASFKVDVSETDTAYTVEAELPGFEKEAISVSFADNYLTIAAKRDNVVKEEKANYIRQERQTGTVQRQFYLDNVDENAIDAAFKKGVLKVTLPKKEKGLSEQKSVKIR